MKESRLSETKDLRISSNNFEIATFEYLVADMKNSISSKKWEMAKLNTLQGII